MGRQHWGWAIVLTVLLGSGATAQQPEDNTAEGLVQLVKQVLALRAAGKSREALPLAKRLAESAPQVLGADAPATATYLNVAGLVYADVGQYAKAEPLYRRGLEIREAKLGKDHLHVSTILNNLAVLYDSLGQYTQAEPLYQRSLEIKEAKLGKDHPDVALSLNNLAAFYSSMGQYSRAEPLYRRSLMIFKAKLGKDHPDVAMSLNNLARLYKRTGHPAQAEPLYHRSLEITEARLGKDHPDVAISLNNLAALYQGMGQPDKAEPLYRRSLAIREAKLGKDHADVGLSLNNLGELYRSQGQYGKAEPLYHRSLMIQEAKIGKEHPDVATSLNNLATLYEATDSSEQAAALAERARRISRRHVARVLPILSQAEQTTFLRHQDEGNYHASLSLGLRHATNPELATRSAAFVLNGKAVAHQTVAEAILLARDSRDPALADLTRRLHDTRHQLARLTLSSPQPGQEAAYQRQLQDLADREQDLARRLRQAGNRNLNSNPWIEHEQLRQAVPAGTAFIDIARFRVFDFKATGQQPKWQPARYAAWVSCQGQPVRLLDLGLAADIDATVARARQALEGASKTIRQKGEPAAEAYLREPLETLGRLVLQPLLPHIGKTERWVLSPDSNLWLVPWAALPLPNGKYAIEEHPISYVVSGRDLVNASVRAPVQPSAPLVLADPDFDLGLDRVALETRILLRGQQPPEQTRGLSGALKLGSIPRLLGTAAEAEAVAPHLRQYTGAEPRLYTDREALAGVFQTARNPKVVLLSTHGFFLTDQETDPKERERLDRTEQPRHVAGVENPLLRCGLLLAGCNHADKAKEGEDNGVLTGLQIVSTDLRGCELVVLSACETGLGDVRNGEGVAGLRQAFQLAGADSVVATLWQVPDQQSAQLMIRFFDNLAQKQAKADALRNAQLALIKARREKNAAAHPFFWAAFTLTGQ